MTNDQLVLYAAGFFDGEGTVSIAKPSAWSRQYKMIVRITQVTELPLKELKKKWGGCVCLRKMNYKNSKHHDIYIWTISNAKARIFLEDVYPYVMVKRAVTILGLEFQRVATRQIAIGMNKHDPLALAYRGTLAELVKDYNQRRLVLNTQ